MTKKWNISQVPALVGITTFTTGFARTPMVLASISEAWGRKLVFTLTGVLFEICQIGCAVTQSYPGMLVARFFAGVGSSTYSSMIGGMISDVYGPNERNTPMAVFSGSALFGTGLGPLICGFVIQYLNWRWIFRIQVIVNVITVVVLFGFVPKTRHNVLLRRKVEALSRWYSDFRARSTVMFRLKSPNTQHFITCENVPWKVEHDEGQGSITRKVSVDIRTTLGEVRHVIYT
ncbi:MFS multidrug transporter [Colletotrichum tofieldiae]|nr:MFS multidrug transporter [Colletotrichum tofieldiae]GKT76783.1 MFS multidrug transporter [Colletotrichum tofieldiae]GKT97441.1 MFS multidrug transporter [Colletotrichum tofieldiae]